MGEMTKDEVNVGLFDECKRLQARIEVLEDQIEGLTTDRDEIRRQYIAEAKETDRLQAKVEEQKKKIARQLEIYHAQRKSMGEESDLIESQQATIDRMHEDLTREIALVNAYAKTIVEQLAKITELTRLLRAAKCPCCDGSGAYYDNMGEVYPCQWCYETKAALTGEENEDT